MQVVLRRTLDYVVWSNGRVLGIIEAPATMIDTGQSSITDVRGLYLLAAIALAAGGSRLVKE